MLQEKGNTMYKRQNLQDKPYLTFNIACGDVDLRLESIQELFMVCEGLK